MIYKACGELAFFAARLPCLWFDFLPPIPPTPFPGGEGGDFFSLFRRGLRPRHPCIKPFVALTELAKQVPGGGLAPGVAVSAGVNGTLRGACPLCRPPTLPLVCLFAPYPPNPLPRQGRGRFFSLFRRGLRPRHPCIKPFAALIVFATVVPCGGLNPGGTGYPCPGGEDHLKRRSSSPPVPPLLGCRHCSPVPRPNRHATRGHR